MMEAVVRAYRAATTKITTAACNRILQKALKHHPPPRARQRFYPNFDAPKNLL